jgi:aconitate hydratase 2 / 2-methylisocitrate dehydratase
VCALLGRIPTVDEYLAVMAERIDPFAAELYRYLNFDQIAGFEDEGRVIALEDMPRIEDILGMPV